MSPAQSRVSSQTVSAGCTVSRARTRLSQPAHEVRCATQVPVWVQALSPTKRVSPAQRLVSMRVVSGGGTMRRSRQTGVRSPQKVAVSEARFAERLLRVVLKGAGRAAESARLYDRPHTVQVPVSSMLKSGWGSSASMVSWRAASHR